MVATSTARRRGEWVVFVGVRAIGQRWVGTELEPDRIAAAFGGDRDALDELYGCYAPVVHRSVAATLRVRPDRARELDDLVNEVWARLLVDGCRRMRGYDPRRGPLGYYLRLRARAMTSALVARHDRREQRVTTDSSAVAQAGEDLVERRVIGRDQLVALCRAVETRLHDIDRVLFYDVLLGGGSVQEVGERLNLSKPAAYRRSHRLRRKLEHLAHELWTVREPVPAAARR